MIQKKNLAIVLGATANMTFAVANIIMSLVKESTNLDFDLFLYHNGITDKDQNLINTIHPAKFIKYEIPDEIRNNLRKGPLERFTIIAYSRFECFKYLEEYKHVLWLDIDTFIKRDISSLFNKSTTGICLFPSYRKYNISVNFINPIDGYDMETRNYNTGVILFQDNLPNYDILTEWCYKKTAELSKYLKCADQGIINLMIAEFNLTVTELDEEFNCHISRQKAKNAYILHLLGDKKLWNYYSLKGWNKYYKLWIKMGGSPYLGKKNTIWSELIKFLKRPRKYIKNNFPIKIL